MVMITSKEMPAIPARSFNSSAIMPPWPWLTTETLSRGSASVLKLAPAADARLTIDASPIPLVSILRVLSRLQICAHKKAVHLEQAAAARVPETWNDAEQLKSAGLHERDQFHECGSAFVQWQQRQFQLNRDGTGQQPGRTLQYLHLVPLSVHLDQQLASRRQQLARHFVEPLNRYDLLLHISGLRCRVQVRGPYRQYAAADQIRRHVYRDVPALSSQRRARANNPSPGFLRGMRRQFLMYRRYRLKRNDSAFEPGLKY